MPNDVSKDFPLFPDMKEAIVPLQILKRQSDEGIKEF